MVNFSNICNRRPPTIRYQSVTGTDFGSPLGNLSYRECTAVRYVYMYVSKVICLLVKKRLFKPRINMYCIYVLRYTRLIRATLLTLHSFLQDRNSYPIPEVDSTDVLNVAVSTLTA